MNYGPASSISLIRKSYNNNYQENEVAKRLKRTPDMKLFVFRPVQLATTLDILFRNQSVVYERESEGESELQLEIVVNMSNCFLTGNQMNTRLICATFRLQLTLTAVINASSKFVLRLKVLSFIVLCDPTNHSQHFGFKSSNRAVKDSGYFGKQFSCHLSS